jgi:predicted O-linked N-acetylglucosamine transferase (SPINDLY family)
VPQGTPSYQNAQNAIARWQQQGQQQQAQSQIQTAREQIQPNQASSYNRAINTLRQIKSGQSGYEQAQELIDQWSRQIYLIANSRAAQGNFQAAVQTAELVPQDTPSHQNAQKAIAKWKQGQR